MLKASPAPRVRIGAILLVAALTTLVVRLALTLEDYDRFLLLLAAVAASAWYGGWKPGMAATVLSGLVLSWFLPPRGSLAVTRPADVLLLCVFLAMALALSSLMTTRRRMRAGLRENETRYRHLVESGLGLICIHDLKGTLLSVNSAAAQLLGYRQTDGISRNLREFLAPRARPLFEEYLHRIGKNGSDDGFMLLATKDGRERMWMYRNVLLQEDGNPPCVLGHAVDVTDLKQAKDELERARRDLEARVMERTAELQQQARSEALASSILRRFLDSPLDEIDGTIVDSLRQASSQAGADTAVFALMAPDRQSFIRSHEWHAQDVPAIPNLLGKVPLTEFPWLFAQVQNPGYVFYRRIEELPDAAAVERARLLSWGVRSAAWLPVHVSGKVNGAIALMWRTRAATVREADIASLGVIADALVSVARRRESEELRRKSEERFQLVAQATNDAIWDWDCGSNEVWWNEGAHALFGHPSGFLPDGLEHGMERIHPEDRERIRSGVKAILIAGGQFWSDEFRYQRADGSYAYVLDRGYIQRDAAGKPLRMIGAMVDISARQRAEQEAKLLHQIAVEISQAGDLDSALAAVLRIGEFTAWTLGQAWVWSSKRQALMLSPACWQREATPDVQQFRRASQAEVLLPGGGLAGSAWTSRRPVWIRDLQQRRTFTRAEAASRAGFRTGAAFPVIARGEVIAVLEFFQREARAEDPRVMELVSTVAQQLSAVMHGKLLEEQLRHSQKMEAIGRVAGGVAHDFNNLLTVLIGQGTLLREASESQGPLAECAQEILECAQRGAVLTRQLLAFSRRDIAQPEMLDLNTVVARMDRMLRQVLGEEIELVTFLDPALDPVDADPNQIEQVMVNLVMNARDAMTGGGRLTIQTSNAVELLDPAASGCLELLPGHYVALTVRDTGQGMDAETLRHIFEPFYTTKKRGHGTGLGLSVVYGIVKQAGGAIAVSSEPGLGAAFTIYLPRAAARAEIKPAATASG